MMDKASSSYKMNKSPGSWSDVDASNSPGRRGHEEAASSTGSQMGAAGNASGAETVDESAIAIPSISLPKGAASIAGMGERFQVNPVNGTGSLSIPLAVTSGRGGFGPQMALSYDSGAGNGPFGLGWSLGIPAITRKTSRGVPQYLDDEESDTFILGGLEDLVRAEEASQTWTVPAGFRVTLYLPRVQKSFERIEKWTSTQDADQGSTHWRVIDGDNITSIYGRTADSQIAGPANQTFSWLLAERYDAKGNAAVYSYKREDSAGVDTATASEQHRSPASRSANLYLKSISYGNRTPNRSPDDWTPFPSAAEKVDQSTWMFTVLLDYGEHDAAWPTRDEVGSWKCRRDAFSSYRAGFEIRTSRLCRRIIMLHHFPDELGGHADVPVSSWEMRYDEQQAAVTCLTGIQQSGFRLLGDGGSSSSELLQKRLPPLGFEYQAAPSAEVLGALVAQGIPTPALAAFAGPKCQWQDLDGEGLPGLVSIRDGSWLYQRNTGPSAPKAVGISDGDDDDETTSGPTFSDVEVLGRHPSVGPTAGGGGSGAFLADLQGDGILELVCVNRPTWGFFARDSDADDDGGGGGWRDFRAFDAAPGVLGLDAKYTLIDLTGDGLPDLLMSDQVAFVWYPSLGELGYGAPQRCAHGSSSDEDDISGMVFSNGQHSVHFADMSGDGLTDLVRIQNGTVSYWPNLGYGRFGPRVTLDNAPWFADENLFEPKAVMMVDVDGTGPCDVLYVGSGAVDVHLNESGSRLGDPVRIAAPALDTSCSIGVVDLFGNGTSCLVWTTLQQTTMYIDFTSRRKPHLLTGYSNGRGRQAAVHYKPSTKFYLDDKAAGRPWITRLPFPVQCVESTETTDSITGAKSTTRYKYHHGYFDGLEREFRGFAAVEQWDVEGDISGSISVVVPSKPLTLAPPTLSRSWFHTGALVTQTELLMQKEYFGGTAVLDDSTLPQLVSSEMTREAHRALKGSLLRHEIYCDDGSSEAGLPYTTTETNYVVSVVQDRGQRPYGVFTVFASEQIQRAHERQPSSSSSDSRNVYSAVLEQDSYGNPTKQVEISLGRATSDLGDEYAAAATMQRASFVKYTENEYTNAVSERDSYRLPQRCRTSVFDISGDGFVFSQRPSLAEAARMMAERLPHSSLLRRSEQLFRSDDLGQILSLGAQQSLGIKAGESKLALQADQLSLYLQKAADVGTATDLLQGLGDGFIQKSGYVLRDGEWWTQTPRTFFTSKADAPPKDELAEARRNFFQPARLVDAFGNASTVQYDGHSMLPVSSSDAAGNLTTCENDYRVLKAKAVIDLNGNKTECVFDEFGQFVAEAMVGRTGDATGDTTQGLDLRNDDAVEQFLSQPTPEAAAKLLGSASKRTIYDLSRFAKGQGQANCSVVLARETHVADSPPEGAQIQMVFSYLDGAGSTVQTQRPARRADNALRWVTSGWAVKSSRDKTLQQWAPYFSDNHEFKRGGAADGDVPTLSVFDALGRAVATINPDRSWSKTEYKPWSTTTYDENDTCLLRPAADANVRFLLPSQFVAAPPLTWYEERQGGQRGAEEQAAAAKTAAHANTPSTAHLEAAGRTILAIADNGPGGKYGTINRYDGAGQLVEFVDAEGSHAMQSAYDLLGRTARTRSMDAGERWTLFDAGDQPVCTWDARGYRITTEYDMLRRPVRKRLRVDGKSDGPVIEMIKYGDSADDGRQYRNARGKQVEIRDQAGVLVTDQYDWQGNAVRTARRFAVDYKGTLDWAGSVDLQEEEDNAHVATRKVDALNRLAESTLADGTTVRHTYGTTGLLQSISGRAPGASDWTAYVADMEYDARAQRTATRYGNGSTTSIEYDPLTCMPRRRTTTRRGQPLLQDLQYTYDASGHVTHARDAAQQTAYFRGQVVDAAAEYTYDAVYRLVEASGREQTAQASSAKPGRATASGTGDALGDGAAMARYIEAYAYDRAGNLVSVKHSGGAGWTRAYSYGEASCVEPGERSNRLSGTSVGGVGESYTYDVQGNMVSMPGLPVMQWDHAGQLRCTARSNGGGGTTTWYVYDAGGQRVRKVTESADAAATTMPARQDDKRVVVVKETLYLDGVDQFKRYNGRGETTATTTSTHIRDDTGATIALAETRTKTGDPGSVLVVRYQICAGCSSVTIELDDQARLMTYEEYSPYGATTYAAAAPALEVPKRYGFNGKERDAENGLHYYGKRYYSTSLGRWTSCDPAGLSGGPNPYAFVDNDPVNKTDPTGEYPVWSHRIPFAYMYIMEALGVDVNAASNGKTLDNKAHDKIGDDGYDDKWHAAMESASLRDALRDGDFEGALDSIHVTLIDLEESHGLLKTPNETAPYAPAKIEQRQGEYAIKGWGWSSTSSAPGLAGQRWLAGLDLVHYVVQGLNAREATGATRAGDADMAARLKAMLQRSETEYEGMAARLTEGPMAAAKADLAGRLAEPAEKKGQGGADPLARTRRETVANVRDMENVVRSFTRQAGWARSMRASIRL